MDHLCEPGGLVGDVGIRRSSLYPGWTTDVLTINENIPDHLQMSFPSIPHMGLWEPNSVDPLPL